MRASTRIGSTAAGFVLALAMAASAQQSSNTPPAMSAEEKAMMDKWQAFMTPGKEHELLAAKVGTWNCKVTMWNAPGAPPQVSDGTAEMVMILDGRYLQDTTHSTFMGMPFEGRGLTGYDNIKKKYVSTWIDNMGTGIMVAEGTYDPATKTLNSMGTSPDVMTGKYIPAKGKEIMHGPDAWSAEMYNPTPDGKGWWKMMQLDYTRKK
jgi:hypothetical protein